MQFFLKFNCLRTIRKCLLNFSLKYGLNIFCMKSMLDFMFCGDINYENIMFCE